MKKKLYAKNSGLFLGGIFLVSLYGCTSMSQFTSWIPFMGGQNGYFQKRHSGQVESYFQAALTYQKKNQHRRAIEEFEMVLGEESANAEAFNGMGVSYDQLREFKKAVGCYKAALRINPALDFVQNNLGYSLLMQGHVDGAITAFKNAIALNSSNKRYHNNLGLAYSQKGEILLAQAEFKLGRDAKVNQSNQLAAGSSDKRFVAPRQQVVSSPVAALPKEKIAKRQSVQSVEAPAATAVEKVVVVSRGTEVSQSQSTPVIETEKKGEISPMPKPATIAASKSAEAKVHSTVVPVASVADTEKTQSVEKKEEHIAAVEVSNGNGVYHAARNWGAYLLKKGQKVSRVSNADHFHHRETVVYYCDGYLQEAYQVAKQIPMYQNMKKVDKFENPQVKIKVVIGEDMIRRRGIFLTDIRLAKMN